MSKVNSHGVSLSEVTSFEMNDVLEKAVPFEQITREVVQLARMEQIAMANVSGKADLIDTPELDEVFPIDVLIGRVLLLGLRQELVKKHSIERMDCESLLKSTSIFSRQGPALRKAAWTVYSTIRSNLIRRVDEIVDARGKDNDQPSKKQKKSEN